MGFWISIGLGDWLLMEPSSEPWSNLYVSIGSLEDWAEFTASKPWSLKSRNLDDATFNRNRESLTWRAGGTASLSTDNDFSAERLDPTASSRAYYLVRPISSFQAPCETAQRSHYWSKVGISICIRWGVENFREGLPHSLRDGLHGGMKLRREL